MKTILQTLILAALVLCPASAQSVETMSRYLVRLEGQSITKMVATKADAEAAISSNPCAAQVDHLVLKITRDATGAITDASADTTPVGFTFTITLASGGPCDGCGGIDQLAKLYAGGWASGPPTLDWAPTDCGCVGSHAWYKVPESPTCRAARTGARLEGPDTRPYQGQLDGIPDGS